MRFTEWYQEQLVTHGCSQNIESFYNGNRTEWSPIRSVIIRVINKIGRKLLITSMITD